MNDDRRVSQTWSRCLPPNSRPRLSKKEAIKNVSCKVARRSANIAAGAREELRLPGCFAREGPNQNTRFSGSRVMIAQEISPNLEETQWICS